MKKTYVVTYIIKDKRYGGMYYLKTLADNARDAIQQVRDAVYKQTGRNAFTPHAYPEDYNAKAYTGFPPAKPMWNR